MSDMESNNVEYRILDNGCYLYKVIVETDNKIISVYQPAKNIDADMKEELSSYTDLVLQSNYVSIFIGKSPVKSKYDINMLTNCRYQGEYNQYYEGNSILIQTSDDSDDNDDKDTDSAGDGDGTEYIFIGGSIFGFKSIAKIDYYLSIFGYNESPLPYALDVNNNIYLLSYGMMITLSENMFKKINSYSSLNELILNSNNDDIKKRFLIDYVKF